MTRGGAAKTRSSKNPSVAIGMFFRQTKMSDAGSKEQFARLRKYLRSRESITSCGTSVGSPLSRAFEAATYLGKNVLSHQRRIFPQPSSNDMIRPPPGWIAQMLN